MSKAITLPTWRDEVYQKGPAYMYRQPDFAREVRNALRRLTVALGLTSS